MSATLQTALAIRSAVKRGGLEAGLSEFFTIQYRDASVGLIRLNQQQRLLLATIERQMQEQGNARVIILKARQIGFSTCSEGIGMVFAFLKARSRGLVISHVEKHAQYLYDIMRRGLRNLPLGKDIENEAASWSMGRTQLGAPLESVIDTATARNVNSGRGTTTQFLHASEVAFYENAEVLMGGLMNSIAREGTIVLFESTANGMGNYFHSEWNRAVEGESDFAPLFFPWWGFDEYQIALASPEEGEEILGTLDDEEERIRDAYGLTLEQLKWRRWCLRNNCGGDLDVFHQEYPAYPEEAFLASGRPVFDSQGMALLLERARKTKPLAVGRLELAETLEYAS